MGTSHWIYLACLFTSGVLSPTISDHVEWALTPRITKHVQMLTPSVPFRPVDEARLARRETC